VAYFYAEKVNQGQKN